MPLDGKPMIDIKIPKGKSEDYIKLWQKKRNGEQLTKEEEERWEALNWTENKGQKSQYKEVEE